MEETKLKEMEEEIKVLKAQIHGVLLDIRETILERTNPLENGGETASIRMDLRTTSQAMAAEAAAHEARNAMEGAQAPEDAEGDEITGINEETEADEELPADPEGDRLSEDEGEVVAAEVVTPPEAEDTNDIAPAEEEDVEDAEAAEDEPPPKVIRRNARELKMLAEQREREKEREQERVEIPPAYRADIAPLSGNGSLSTWLTHALETIGPVELSRIIAVHRAWGHLPPNLSRALAYVQEMLEETEDTDPPWLHVMQELDELASL